MTTTTQNTRLATTAKPELTVGEMYRLWGNFPVRYEGTRKHPWYTTEPVHSFVGAVFEDDVLQHMEVLGIPQSRLKIEGTRVDDTANNIFIRSCVTWSNGRRFDDLKQFYHGGQAA